MKEEKLLTVSIAAYNVEKYLEQTLRSLNDKRFIDELEVLIIDDGSKDGTADIALKYQEFAPDTFRYIRKENGGHGSTINKGIELARGKYFRVIDGDDWVDTDAFSEYMNKLKKTDSDIVLTQNMIVRDNNVSCDAPIGNITENKLYVWSEQPDIRNISMHMITIKTELLRSNSVQITEKCFYVDVEFVVRALYLAQTLVFWNLYVYMYRAGNVSQSMSMQNLQKNIEMQKTVAYRLTDIFSYSKKTGNIETAKEKVVLRRIERSIRGVILTYLSFEDGEGIRDSIASFENNIKKHSQEMYDYLGKNLFFRAVRAGHYSMIPLVRAAYKLYHTIRH